MQTLQFTLARLCKDMYVYRTSQMRKCRCFSSQNYFYSWGSSSPWWLTRHLKEKFWLPWDIFIIFTCLVGSWWLYKVREEERGEENAGAFGSVPTLLRQCLCLYNIPHSHSRKFMNGETGLSFLWAPRHFLRLWRWEQTWKQRDFCSTKLTIPNFGQSLMRWMPTWKQVGKFWSTKTIWQKHRLT